MRKVDILVLAATLAVVLPGPNAAAGNDIQGRVVSIVLTNDCPAEGTCAANVGLTARDGRVMTFHVRPDTEIASDGKLITLSQLRLGDQVGIPAYDAITTEMRTAKPALFD